MALAGTASRDLHAQDSISRIFRDALTEIAVASELPRLDSAALLPGVRREIRIYDGFGLGSGNRVVRLVEHTHGVDGQLGVFWPSQNWGRAYSSPAAERRARDEDRAWDDHMLAHVDKAYDCHMIKQTRAMRVCWLPERPDARVALTRLLARLDSLGIDSIPSPLRQKTAWMDGSSSSSSAVRHGTTRTRIICLTRHRPTRASVRRRESWRQSGKVSRSAADTS